tara:strand:- start:1616 stop:1873 length:258 start_codon:yes stop_codon:yes gene_type:complete
MKKTKQVILEQQALNRHIVNLDYKLDYSKIDNIDIDGIDYKDYPDFCDAYIESADYDGVPMTSQQLDSINDDSDFRYEAVMNHIQ